MTPQIDLTVLRRIATQDLIAELLKRDVGEVVTATSILRGKRRPPQEHPSWRARD